MWRAQKFCLRRGSQSKQCYYSKTPWKCRKRNLACKEKPTDVVDGRDWMQKKSAMYNKEPLIRVVVTKFGWSGDEFQEKYKNKDDKGSYDIKFLNEFLLKFSYIHVRSSTPCFNKHFRFNSNSSSNKREKTFIIRNWNWAMLHVYLSTIWLETDCN